jgi:predicted kinase
MKQLIITCGLPGVGKSTIAEGISRELNILVLSVDPIESVIIQSGIEKSFETGLAAYKVAETIASETLKLDHSVIIDAVCGVNEAKQMWRDLAAEYGAKLEIIECICSDISLHQQRIEARVRSIPGIPEVTWARVEEQRKAYLPWPEATLVLDAKDSSEDNISKAIKYLTN